jgi:hypothetical protein
VREEHMASWPEDVALAIDFLRIAALVNTGALGAEGLESVE